MSRRRRPAVASTRRQRALARKRRASLRAEALETRTLFSADNPFADIAVGLNPQERLLQHVPDAFIAMETEHVDAAATATDQAPVSVVIVDANIPDLDLVLADLTSRGDASLRVHVLDAGNDGLAALDAILSTYTNIEALHLFSHGSDGALQLGAATVGLSDLFANATALNGWQDRFTKDADILLYGCDLAGSEAGVNFINTLATLTGADVAASEDKTGSAVLGGDWELEAATGSIETELAVGKALQQAYSSVLATFDVSNLNDSGAGSLRQAIANANSASGSHTITFSVAGTISLTSALPQINETVNIDATGAPGYSGTPVVVLDGSSQGSGDGLTIGGSADNSTVRGLAIINMPDDGISITIGATNVAIQGNWIGTSAIGSTTEGNGGSGVDVRGHDVQIGGAGANDGNVIVNNNSRGIYVQSENAVIEGNLIGVDPDGVTDQGNTLSGIYIVNGASALVGGTSVSTSNTIAFNGGDGVEINGSSSDDNSVVGNSIYDNDQLGIDLVGTTTNDVQDVDFGVANDGQNYPLITSAEAQSTSTRIVGTLNTNPSTTIRIDFYAAGGANDAERHLGFTTVTTDGSGDASYDVNLAETTSGGEYVTAVATVDLGGGNLGSSSQLGPSQSVTSVAPTARDDGDGYSDSVLDLAPLSYLRLGESSGAVDDIGSLNNDGTRNGPSTGAVGALSGDTDTAYDFDGTNDYVEIPHDAAYDLAEGSFQLWFNADDLSGYTTLFSKDANGNGDGHFEVRIHDGDIEFRAQTSSSTVNIGGGPTLSTNTWYHLTVSFDASGVRLYLDGTEIINDSSHTIGLSGNSEPIALGMSTQGSSAGSVLPGTWYFDGRIDEFAIFSQALTASQASSLYNAGLTGGYAVAEGGTLVVSAANGVLANDSDPQGDTLTATLISGPSYDSGFTLNSDGSFTYNHDGSEASTDTFVYEVDDGNGNTDQATVTITINPVNDDPVFTSSNSFSVAENLTAVGVVTTSDFDGGTPQYTLVGSDDDTLFSIDINTGALSFDAAPDFETPADGNTDNDYQLTVQVDDGSGGIVTQSVTVTVTDANDNAPVITPGQMFDIDESASVSDSVGTVAATDLDTIGSLSGWTITAGNGDGVFAINAGTGEITIADTTNLNHEGSDQYTLTVEVSDGVATVSETVTIDINDINEAPTFTSSAITSATEDVLYSYLITANDVDDGDTPSFSAIALPSWLTLVDNGNGTATLSGTPTNSEVGGHSVDIQISDGSLTANQAFTVTVVNVNDDPIFTSSNTFSIAENQIVVGTVTSSDVDGGAPQYTLVGSDDDGLFSIDINTGAITFDSAPNFEAPADGDTDNDYEITVQVDDGAGGVVTQSVTITVTNVDEFDVGAISDTNAGANEVSEGASTGATVGITAFANDADAPDTISYTLDNDAGGLFTIDGATGVVTVAGALDRETAGSHNIVVRATSTDTSFNTQLFTITILDVNDTAPVITPGQTFDIDEDASVSDSAGTVAATDADTTGTLSGWAITAGNGDGVFAINAGTGEITIADTTNLNHEGSDQYTLTVEVSDGVATVSETVTIDINDINEAPTFTSSAITSATEDVLYSYLITANDVDDGDTPSFSAITLPAWLTLVDNGNGTATLSGTPTNNEVGGHSVDIQISDGSLTANQAFTLTVVNVNDDPVFTSSNTFSIAENQTAVGTVTSSDVDGGAPQYTLIGSDDDSLFNIDINTGALTFDSAPNFEAPADGDTDNDYEITVQVDDGAGGVVTQSVTVTVTNVDEFDVGTISDTNAGANEVSEGASTGASVGITAFAEDADSPDTVSYTLDDSAGGRFTIDGLTGVVTVNGALDREAAPTHDITVRATSTDGSFQTQTFTITLLDVNDTAPVITPAQTFDIDEDASVSDSVGTVAATDADTTGTLSGWAIIGGNADGVFAINASTGEITIADTTNLNHEGSDQYTLTIEVSDGIATVSETVTIDINDVNEAPTFTSSAITSATEDVLYSYLITANDVDDGDTPNFSAITLPAWLTLVDNGNGTATLSGTPTNSEVGGHSVDVQISDGSLTANQAFTLTVINVNDDPVFTSSSTFSIAENQTAIGAVTSSDVDGGAPQYTLVGSDDDSLFSIDINTGALAFASAPNFEAPADGDTDNDYEITVQVDDGAGGVVTQTVTVTVTNVDEFDVGAISDTNAGANEVSEGASAGATVGITAFADDADSPDTVSYTLDDSAGGRFTIDGLTGVVTVNGALDREAAPTHDITVRATSTDGSFQTQTFTITLLDVNDTAPVVTPGQTFDIDEDASVSDSVGTVAATDADTTGTLSGWAITAGNGDGVFAINASTGEITIADTTNLNHEGSDQYTLTIEVSDGVATVSETVTIDINDINEAPTFTSSAITSATEDVLYSYLITATDVDDGDTPNYSAITLPAWLTLVDNGNGTATLSGTPTNAEVGGHSVDIQISDGSLTANQAFTLTVVNVNDDPVFTSSNSFAIAENQTAVGTITSTDVDGGAPQYTLVGSDDDGLFSIDINTGALTFNAAPDFEAPADDDTDNDYEITVQVDDGAGGTVTQSLTVTVQDANDNAPVIVTSQVFSVSESASNSDIVGAVLATDADGVGGLQNWMITAGNADGVFQIDPSTGVVSVADNSNLDFDTTNEYTLTLTVEDGANTSVSQTITINVLSSAISPVAIDDGGNYVSLLSSYGPLSYWRLGEPSGSSAADSGSLANAGSINGATLGAAGAIAGDSNTSAQFDGVDDYIEIAHDPAYELAAGTVQLWFNQDDDSGSQSLISKDATGTSDGHFDVRITDGDLILRLQTDTGQIQLRADDVVSQNEWYHLAVSFDSNGARLYLNGELVLSTTGHTIGLSDNPEPWAIGMSTISSAAGSVLPGNRHFSGTIDEVAIFGQALNANQIRDLYGAGTSDYVVSEGGTLVVNAADGVLANDFDPQDDTLTATLISSTAAGFSLNADGSFTYNHDGSENATESFVYEISDGNGNFAQATATITVLAVNDDPVFTSSSTFSIAENQTAIGTVTSSDVDGGAPQYSLVGSDDGSLFSIDVNTGVLTFDSAPNFEAPADGDTDNDYEITVQVDDGAGGVVTQIITVTVTNVDEFDVGTISDTNAGANEVSEDASAGATVGITAFADDADSPDTVSYTLDDSAGGRFTIDGLTGAVTVSGALDREAAPTHDITVRATSTDGSFQTQTFTITLLDVNDNAPTITADQTFVVAGDASIGTSVGSAVATDPDTSGSLQSWTIVSGNADGIFAIDGLSGEITVTDPSNLDFATTSTYDLVLNVADGVATSASESVRILVTNPSESPFAADDGMDYVSAITGQSPLGYWRLGESSGSAAVDLGSVGNNGTYVGAALGAAGVVVEDGDTAASFDGTDDHVVVSDQAAYQITNGTIQAWIKPDSVGGIQTFIAKDSSANGAGDFGFYLNNGRLSVEFETGSGPRQGVYSNVSVDVNEWNHVAVTFGSNGLQLYLNGQLIGTNSGFTGGFVGNTNDFVFGMDNISAPPGSNLPGSNFFSGDIDEVALIGTQLTATQIAELYGAATTDYDVVEGGTLVVNTANGVLANDSDPQGDTLTATLVSGPAFASSFTLNSDGSFSYDHDGSEAITDSFVYEVNDGNGHIDHATVTITINPVNDDPVFTSSGTFSIAENQTAVGTVTSSDVDGGTPQYTLVGSDDDGLFSIDINTGALTFDSAPNFEAPADADSDNDYEITVQVDDGAGGVVTQSITVTVTNVDEFDVGTISDTNAGTNEVSEGASTGSTVGITAFAEDLDSPDTVSYTLDDSAGGRFTIDGLTGVVTVNGALDREASPTHDITVRATSTDGSFQTQTFTITLLDVNDTAPVITPAQTFDINEDASFSDSVGSVLATDPDTTGTLSGWAITAGNGDGVFAINASTGEITIADTTNLNHEGSDQYTLTIEVSDGVATVSETVTIDINDINEAPTFSSSAITTATEDVLYSYLITATDVDDGDTPNFSAITLPAWLTLVDNGNGTATLSGTPTNAEVGGHSVNIQISDGSLTANQSFTLTVVNVNDDPVFTSSNTFSIAENLTAVGTVTSADVDGGAPQYTLVGSDDDSLFGIGINTGVLTFNTAPDFETPTDADTDNDYEITVQVDDGAGGVVTQSVTVTVTNVDEFDVGSISDSNAGANEVSEGASTGATVGITAFGDDLDSPDTISYTLDDDAGGLFVIDGSTGVVTLNGVLDREIAASHNITVRATSTDTSFSTQTFTIAVLDVNDTPPIITPGQTFDIDEDAGVSASVGTVVATDADITGTLAGWTITAGNGDGVFAINASTGEITIADTSNLNHEGSDQYTLTLEVSDGVATVSETVTIDINDINETPTFTSSPITSATEDVLYSYLITANDVDDGDTPSFSAITLPAWLTLVDNGDGTATLSGTPTNDEVGGHSVDIQISDGSLTTNQAFTLTVVNVNDDPVFTSSNTFSIAENQTAVGTITSSDVDGGAPQYTLVGGDDDGLFSIDINTGALTFNSAPNFEAPVDGDTDNDYEITVQVDDGAGGVVTQSVTVTVTNVDEFDVGTISDTNTDANEISEGASAGAAVGITAFADDLDAPDTVSYTLDDDAGGLFVIDGVTGIVTLNGALDRESAASHDITVRATSTDTSFSTQTFTITVLDLNDTAPVITPGQTFDIDEDASVSDSVGTVVATDADITGALSGWTIIGGNGDGVFAINASTGELTIADTTNLNHEGSDQYTLTIEVSDGVATVSETVTIDINDINETPTFTSSPIASATEDVLYSYLITAADVDDGDTPSFSAVTLPAWLTLVDNGDGTATLSGTPTNDEVGGHSVDIQISDGSLTANQAFTLTVVNVNDDPAFTSPNSFSIAENQTAIGTVTSSDVDGGAPLYSLVGTDDDALFSIDINTGALTFNAAPDFEAPADGDSDNVYEITVQVSDGAGGVVNQNITVTVTNVDEFDVGAISDQDSDLNEVSEGATPGATVGITAFADDPDAPDTITYSLDDSASGLFAIDSATGVVTLAGTLDYELATSHSITVRATSTDGSFATAGFVIAVGNLNDTAPVVTPGQIFSVAEDATVGTPVGFVAGTDADALGPLQDWAITAGNDDAIFTIDPVSGGIRVTDTSALNFESRDQYVLTIQVSDGLNVSTGTITIDITDVNETPTFTSTPVVGGTQDLPYVYSITTDDVDGDPLTIVPSGSLPSWLTLTDNGDGTATLSGIPVEADIGSHNIELTVSDGSLSSTQTFTIVVDNVNDAPVITSPNLFVVAENTLSAGQVTSTDVDGAAPLYTLVGSDDDGLFNVDANTGALTFNSAPDFETPLDGNADNEYEVTVQVDDMLGGTTLQVLTIRVTNVNEFSASPVVDSDAAADAVTENAVSGTTVGITVSSDDFDAGDIIAYSLDDDAGGRFTIDPLSGIVTLSGSVDFETAQQHSITVRATSTDLSVATRTFVIDVLDLNDNAPVVAPGFTFGLSEDSASGTGIGLVTATDVDSIGSLSYAIVAGDPGGVFSLDAISGALTLADASQLDFETTPVYSLTVEVSDGVQAVTTTVTVGLTNVNEAPSAPSLDNAQLPEHTDTSAGVAVGTLSSLDPDAGDALVFTVVGGLDAAVFSIDGNRLIISDGELNFERQDSYEVTVRVTDGGGLTADTTFTILTLDRNDVPEPAVDSLTTLEDEPLVIDLNADLLSNDSDEDGDALAVTAYTQPSHGSLIDNGDGTLTYTPNPQYFGADAFRYEVTDGNGGTVWGDAQLSVVSVNDAPIVLVPATIDVGENGFAVTVTSVTDVEDAEPQMGLGGADAASFSIDGATGEIQFVANPDYETPADADGDNVYEINVLATDSDGATTTQSVSVTVLDRNDAPEVTASTDLIGTPGAGVIGAISLFDQDSADTLTVTIVPGLGSEFFSIDGATGEVLVLDDADPGLYSLQFEVSDGNGGTATGTLNVSVALPETPDTDAPDADKGPAPGTPVAEDSNPDDSGDNSELEDMPLQEPQQGAENADAPPRYDRASFTEELGFSTPDLEQFADEQARTDQSLRGLQLSGVTRGHSLVLDLLIEQGDGVAARFMEMFGSEADTEGVSLKLPPSFVEALDRMQAEFEEQSRVEDEGMSFSVGSSAAATISLTAGFLTWLLRTGSLLTTALSTAPLWRGLDPIPVLTAASDDEEEEPEQDARSSESAPKA